MVKWNYQFAFFYLLSVQNLADVGYLRLSKSGISNNMPPVLKMFTD